ncbi:ATP-binding protein [Nocardia salmonicida]|uniref:ATP-binding protein n=1 Tax=Nocardia salmonicida TaxID=53431 RepID=UPI0007A4864C|nr:ATP-binding protein [Nocardia salmonicida]
MQTPAVGRHEELARLRAAVVAAASGAGRFVLVSGPAGIGKSWLAECVATLAIEAGLRVARGNSFDDAGMPPLWPWRRAARELPELAAALDTVTEPGGGPEVRYWLEQRGRTTDLAQRVHERTDGTPLLVRLVIESGTDLGDDPLLSVPGIRRLILARLDRFDPAEVEILGAASVLGERIDADLLARVYTSVLEHAPSSDDQVSKALDTATTAGIVRRFADETTGFTHALVRDAVYADLVPSRRAAYHRAAAEALAARGGPDSAVAGAIATHWRHACARADSPQARHWSRRAARSARASAAYAEAIRFGQWAIDAASTVTPDAERAQLLIELARDEFAAGWVATSLDHCVEAGALAERADRPDLLAEAGLVVQGVTTPAVMTRLDLLCGKALRLLDPTSEGSSRHGRSRSRSTPNSRSRNSGDTCGQLTRPCNAVTCPPSTTPSTASSSSPIAAACRSPAGTCCAFVPLARR